MRGTVAKQLRRMANYKVNAKPKTERKYVSTKTTRYDSGKTDGKGEKHIIEMQCLAVADHEPRCLYQELKKEYKKFGYISE